MQARALWLLTLVFVLLCVVSHAHANRVTISALNLLLPYNSTGTIVSSTGSDCLFFSTSKSDVIKLEPVGVATHVRGRPCVKAVKVIPISDVSEIRKSSLIVAETREGQQALCEVYVDTIHSLQILTSTRKLAIGELEQIKVQAFDKEGNVFSSLNGLKFSWSSETIDEKKRGSVKLISITDTRVKLDVEPELLSEDPLSQHVIVANGQSVGEVLISVKLKSKDVSHVAPFYVMDNLYLDPSPVVRVLAGSEIRFKLRRRNFGTDEVIEMPNPRYKWITGNDDIGTISQLGVFHAKNLGEVEVKVVDTEFQFNEANSQVYVVRAKYTKLFFNEMNPQHENIRQLILQSMLCGDNVQSVVVKRTYNTTIEVYDDKDYKLYDADYQYNIKASSDFQVTMQHTKKHFTLLPLQLGQGSIEVEVITVSAKVVAADRHTILIHNPVLMDLPLGELVLPVDDIYRQSIEVRGSGGSSVFKLLSSNPQVVEIRDKIAITVAEGESFVVLIDNLNCMNFDFRKVFAQVPHSLAFLPGPREAQVSHSLCLKYEMLDVQNRKMLKFDMMQVVKRVVDATIFSQLSEVSALSANCSSGWYEDVFAVLAQTFGFTSAKLAYKTRISAKTPIAAFNPLRYVEPADEGTVAIALGSSLPFVTDGGPVAWGDGQSKVVERVQLANEDALKMVFVSREGTRRTFDVTCLDVHEQDVTVVLRHTFSTSGIFETVVSVTRKVSCQMPQSLKIVPLNSNTMAELTPESTHTVRRYTVRNNQTVPVKLSIYDINGDKFLSFYSVHVSWQLLHAHFAQLRKTDKHDIVHVDMTEKDEGILRVSASLTGFIERVIRSSGAKVPKVFPELSDTIELRVTSNIGVVPSEVLLYKGKGLHEVICAHGGSGKYDFAVQSNHIISMNPVNASCIAVYPLHLGTTKVLVTDVQFASSAPAVSLVRVADISKVLIEGPNFVEQSQSITLHIKVYADDGQLFPERQYHAMNIRADLDRDGTALLQETDKSHIVIVTGVAPGIAKVTASANSGDSRTIYSPMHQIQVYSPLSVVPSQMLLIPGALYQVQVNGGPANAELVFSMENHSSDDNSKEVATVDNKGFVTAITYGTCMLVVKKHVFNRGILATVRVPVKVVKLTGLQLPSSISLYQHRVVPVSLVGISDDGMLTPIFMQSPYFKTIYSVDHTDIAVISEPYSIRSHSVFVKSKNVGSTRLKVVASFTHPLLQNYQLTSGTPVIVEEKLLLVDNCDSEMIVAPKASHVVKTTKDSTTALKYTLMKSSKFENIINHIDKSGRFTTKSTQGMSIVVVEDTLGQTVAQPITVAYPHYLSVQRQSALETNEFKLPLGSELKLRLLPLSERADAFATINAIDLKLATNNHDALSFTINEHSETLDIVAKAFGNSTIEISSALAKYASYWNFVICSGITPYYPKVHIGETVAFSISDMDGGTWLSEDEAIVRVSSSTGAAKAQSIGETRVVYKTATSSSSSPISVIKVTYAKLDQTLSTSSRKVVRLFDNEDRQFVPSKASAIKFECKSTPELPLRTEVSDYGVICIVPTVQEEQNIRTISLSIEVVVSRTLTLNVPCDSEVQVGIVPKARESGGDKPQNGKQQQQQQQQTDVVLDEDESFWSVLKKIILTLLFAGLFLVLYAFC